MKDFTDLFCKEKSACLVHSIIASFGHLLRREKPWLHEGTFFHLQTIANTSCIYYLCHLRRWRCNMCAYLHFTGITLSNEAHESTCPGLSPLMLACDHRSLYLPQTCSSIHPPCPAPVEQQGYKFSFWLPTGPFRWQKIWGVARMGSVKQRGKWMPPSSNCSPANISIFFNIYIYLNTNVFAIRYEVPLIQLLSGSVCMNVS